MFLGDDFHHNGAFRLSYGFEYVGHDGDGEEQFHFEFDRTTLTSGIWTSARFPTSTKYFHGKLPTWNDFVTHPNYDDFWQKQAFAPYLKRSRCRTLNVAGWWDQEDFYGPLKIYELFEKNDTKHLNYLVAGPWNHGGWAGRTGPSSAPIDFGSNTASISARTSKRPGSPTG